MGDRAGRKRKKKEGEFGCKRGEKVEDEEEEAERRMIGRVGGWRG